MLRQFAASPPPPVPPTLNLVRTDDVAPTRWRNGGGWTRELVAWPSASDWIVRVSVADIAAEGPFSAFPGVDRWFAVLDGEGVELVDGSGTLRLRQGDAIHRFRGEAAPHCRLVGGATRDFNVMVRRDAAVATVTPLPSVPAVARDWSACFAVVPMRIRIAGDARWQSLPECALAWTTSPARLEVDADGGVRGWGLDVRLAKVATR